MEPSASENLVLPPAKRPFCNRYGGCSAVGRLMGASRKRWGFDREESNNANQDAFTANLITLDALADDPYRQKMRNYLRP
ncbi:hypothetical protein RvY_04014 [Ramazzottius varieornatus]|uniref:Uncharacterized protein n=1 Tax=Ramazzottius varieornatus TaxID=947166 RepID=A0A1D1UQ49_RAMVA|nr:hypothetical protein RvY_04014 [Ramazzottius varieornatus]